MPQPCNSGVYTKSNLGCINGSYYPLIRTRYLLYMGTLNHLTVTFGSCIALAINALLWAVSKNANIVIPLEILELNNRISHSYLELQVLKNYVLEVTLNTSEDF